MSRLYFIIPISILFVVFFSLLTNYILDEKNIKKVSDSDKRLKLREKFIRNKFNTMMVIGLIGIIIGVYFNKIDDKYGASGTGIAIGGVFTIVSYVILNWYTIQDIGRIFIIGVTFVSLMYGSFYFLA